MRIRVSFDGLYLFRKIRIPYSLLVSGLRLAAPWGTCQTNQGLGDEFSRGIPATDWTLALGPPEEQASRSITHQVKDSLR